MRRRILVGHSNLILATLSEECEMKEWKFKSNPEELHGQNEWDNCQCVVWSKDFEWRFGVQQMPGCCAVLILHHVNAAPYTRENVNMAIELVERAAYKAGFGSVQMAQVVRLDGNGRPIVLPEPWAHCIRRWKVSAQFINAKSGNAVVYLTKNLDQPGKRAGFEEIF